MDEQQLRQLKPELDLFLQEYAPLFGRPQNQEHARLFLQGLLHGGDRRNIENIAENIDGCVVRSLQAFIATGVWQDRQVLARLRHDAVQVLADDDAVWNSDETGFAKKGTKSVGVKRQYSGTLGRTDNCQIGVFANYFSVKGHTMMDRRLFLPEEWANDRERRGQAGVPDEVVFRSKPELALEMLTNACAEQIPIRWVGGDSVYGNSPTFVQGVRELSKWYVLDVSSEARVWTEEPQVIPPEQRPRRGGRPPTRPQVIGESQPVDQVIAKLPASAWQRVVVAEGSQGPRVYEYAEVWVWFSEEGMPGPRERLLARRSLSQEPEIKYHRSNAVAEVKLEKLAWVRGTRWSIEEDIQSGKGECGLDEYETRGWLGWHHHTCLSMLALLFLTLQKQRLGEKRRSDERPGGSRGVKASAGSADLGRSGDPEVVGMEKRTKSASRRKPSKATARRVAASAK